MGEGSTPRKPVTPPMAAIHRVGRIPMVVPSAAEVGLDHQDPAVAEPVRPRARVQLEDEAGQPDGGG